MNGVLSGPDERERRHAREDLAGGDGDVVDGADLLAGGVDDRLAQHLGQVDHGFPLPPGLAASRERQSPAGRLAVAPRGARRRIGRSPRGLGTVRFHVGPCRSATGRTTKKPLRPRRTRGSGSRTGPVRWLDPRASQGRAHRAIHRSHPSSVDLALSDVGRTTRGVVDAAGMPASAEPSHLSLRLKPARAVLPIGVSRHFRAVACVRTGAAP